MKRSLGAKTQIYPTPVWIVCTYDKAGKPNGMAAAWGGVACSQPPALTVSLRKATYSYQCIVDRKAYTVCVPSEDQVKEADYFGIASGRNTNKFDDTGLTPVKSDLVDAPYIAEFPMVLECKLIHTFEIGLHTMFVGEILDVKVDEDMVNADGNAAIEQIRPIIYAPGLQTYHGVGHEIGRGYKTGKEVK